jgi:2-phospho-L-lactate guanylyltransferase
VRALWAVLPVKGFARGKSRLGTVLSDPVRAAFARSLFEHVAAMLCAHEHVAGLLVVTDDDEVEALARQRAFHVLRDPPSERLSDVVDAGLQHVAGLGASAAIVCMADLPHLSADDVREAVEALVHHDVVLAPDLARAGTNLFGIVPPDRMPSCFGRADSFERHKARAFEHGLSVQILERHGLCFDVDGPADLPGLA